MRLKNVLACLTVGAVLSTSVMSVNAAEYTIQPGDTLSKIASSSGVSVKDIMNANGITDANKIVAGKTLTLSNAPISADSASALYELFDAELYAKKYPDVVAAYGESKDALFKHFSDFGLNEGRTISSTFDVNAYKSAYPDLQKAFENDLSKYYEHFLTFGQKEERKLVTTEACLNAGITVSDPNGKAIAVPAPKPPQEDSSSSAPEDEFWMTGTWYNVEFDVDPSGVMKSQGACPYKLFAPTKNEDGSVTCYLPTGHGGWVDGEFVYGIFDFTDYEEGFYFSSTYDQIGLMLGYCSNTITNEYMGIYDEGCIHKVTFYPAEGSTPHEWETTNSEYQSEFVCKNCGKNHFISFNYRHADMNEDGHCDVCDMHIAPHEHVDADSNSACDICNAGTDCADNDGDEYCDDCFRYLKRNIYWE